MIRALPAAMLLAAMRCSGSTPPSEPPAPATDEVVGKPAAEAKPHEDEAPKKNAPVHTGLCGSAGLSLPDYDWVPSDAQAAIAIDVADPGATAALKRLADYGRSDDHELPITLAFAVTQWPIMVPVLGSMLDGLGQQPAELVFVAPAKGPSFAWVWHSDCDLDEEIERVSEQWGLVARRRVEGVVVTTPPDPAAGDGTLANPNDEGESAPPEDGDTRFPYDVVFAAGQRVALVPRGEGDAFLRQLPGPGQAGTPAWTERLSSLSEAPIRGVLTGRALLGPKARRAASLRGLTVGAEALALDAIVTPK